MGNLSPKQQVMQLITGGWVSQAVYAAAKLGIADNLALEPRTADELAEQLNCNAGALHRLLRALASVGLFEELEEHRFSLTETGDCLRTDSPDSVRMSSIMRSEIFYKTWGEVLHSIQTGDTAFSKIHGTSLFDYLADNVEQAQLFDAAMVSGKREEAEAVVAAYDWPQTGKVIDVGGGSGGLLLNVLDRCPELKGVIFDLPEVIDRNETLHEKNDTSPRCELQSGDFFSAVPKGADIYLLRNIIHDWNDEDSLRILRNCRDACHPTSKVVLLEYVIPPGSEPFGGKWPDLMMLVGVGGLERTEVEYRELLDVAGLRVTRVIPTTSEMSIIESQPVK